MNKHWTECTKVIKWIYVSVDIKYRFDNSDQGMFRWAFWSPDHVQRTNVDCGGTVQVPAGRHPVRRLPAGGHPRKQTGLRQHFFSRHRLGQHQDYSQRKSVCPNNGPPFAKGQSAGIIFSSVTVPYPDSRVLPAQHSSDCKCLRSSCPYGLRTVQSEQSRQANKQQQQHVWWPSWFPKGHNASADKFSDGGSRRKLSATSLHSAVLCTFINVSTV